MKDIIACFENPVYGTVEKINDYTITIYDKKFERYQIVLDGDAVEDGHHGVEKIYSRRPWIIREDQSRFEESAVSASGRRALIKELERAKRGETAPAQIESEDSQERPQKTNRRRLLGRREKKKIAMQTVWQRDISREGRSPAATFLCQTVYKRALIYGTQKKGERGKWKEQAEKPRPC